MSQDAAKRNAANKALEKVEPDMTLGLGTGSTAACFIAGLKDLNAGGFGLKGVPTSEGSRRLAVEAGIEIIEPDETTTIHLAVDGADEIDVDRNLIKGGGGALLREKIVARAAERFIVIADRSKDVATLGRFPLPLEIEPFGWALTVSAVRGVLSDHGFDAPPLNLRSHAGKTFLSDGGHVILDCALERIDEPAILDRALGALPGVIETGLFCGLTSEIIYG